MVLGSLRPIIQALAPRATRARTCAEQMVPAPPVQKTTLLSGVEVSWGSGNLGLVEKDVYCV